MKKNLILAAALAIQCSILGANTLEKAYFDGDNPPPQSNYEGWDLRQVVFDTVDIGGFNFASANLLSVEILSSDNGEYFKDLNFADASWSAGKFSSSASQGSSSVINANFSAHRQTQWDEEERGDKRRRKTIRKRERQRG